LRGIRGAARARISPDISTSNAVGGICNPAGCILQRCFVNEAFPDVEQLLVAAPSEGLCVGLL
jgi:hypothetical protein